MPSIHGTARTGFDVAAAAYERARPSYPTEAVQWLVERLRIRPGSTLVTVLDRVRHLATDRGGTVILPYVTEVSICSSR